MGEGLGDKDSVKEPGGVSCGLVRAVLRGEAEAHRGGTVSSDKLLGSDTVGAAGGLGVTE